MTIKQSSDRQVKVEGIDYQALVNFSPLNQRVVIKKYQGENLAGLKEELISRANPRGLDKIWVKALSEDEDKFKQVGFNREAVINSFYPEGDAVLMAYYLTEQRSNRENKKEQDRKLKKAKAANSKPSPRLDDHYQFKIAKEKDISQLAQLYDEVFDSYPYPINKQTYLQQMMEEGVIYGAIYYQQNLIAAASAEVAPEYKNAEMTDFATFPAHRGKGLATYLLKELEEKVKEKDYNCLYTIARASVVGINKVFSQSGYNYTGTLVKNCNIAGGLESMNVWCKVV